MGPVRARSPPDQQTVIPAPRQQRKVEQDCLAPQESLVSAAEQVAELRKLRAFSSDISLPDFRSHIGRVAGRIVEPRD